MTEATWQQQQQQQQQQQHKMVAETCSDGQVLYLEYDSGYTDTHSIKLCRSIELCRTISTHSAYKTVEI